MTSSSRALALAAGALVLVGVAGCAASATPLPGPRPSPSMPYSTSSTPARLTTPPVRPKSATPRPTTTSPARTTPSTTSSAASTGTTISGYVIDGTTGAPIGGVIVEFKNLLGENVHTYTRSDGSYAVRVPPDVYRALALDDDPDSRRGFRVLGGGDNTVSVPPSARVDFESYTY